MTDRLKSSIYIRLSDELRHALIQLDAPKYELSAGVRKALQTAAEAGDTFTSWAARTFPPRHAFWRWPLFAGEAPLVTYVTVEPDQAAFAKEVGRGAARIGVVIAAFYSMEQIK